jgi:putative resolvase
MYVSRRKFLEKIKISKRELYKLIKTGKIEIIKLKNKNLYNLDKFMEENGHTKNEREKICYCRVSSKKQNKDLERQIEFMKKLYPNYKIISDIGSSLNFERKGLLEIIEKAIKGEIEELIIAYKDRLARIGYRLIEIILEKYSKAKIIIVNKEPDESVNDEITKDIMAIMNIYVAKINGSRKYKSK